MSPTRRDVLRLTGTAAGAGIAAGAGLSPGTARAATEPATLQVDGTPLGVSIKYSGIVGNTHYFNINHLLELNVKSYRFSLRSAR